MKTIFIILSMLLLFSCSKDKGCYTCTIYVEESYGTGEYNDYTTTIQICDKDKFEYEEDNTFETVDYSTGVRIRTNQTCNCK